MKAIMGIVHPIDGSIQVSGHDLKTHDLVDLRSKIVFIGQDTVLLNKNIVDNMMEGNSATKAEVIELLTKYQLDKVFQNGINTIVEQNGNNLNQGNAKSYFYGSRIVARWIHLFDRRANNPCWIRQQRQRSLK